MTKDNVNHPDHYTNGTIECIDALKAATTGLEGIDAVCTANAIKYLWRWKFKNGIEDLNKALWYINRLIKENTEEPTIYEHDGCTGCKFFNKNPCASYLESCVSCRGTKLFGDKSYYTAPDNYQPIA